MNFCNQVSCEPRRPLDSDCCGLGCRPCVFDLYEDEMRIWNKEREAVSSTSTTNERMNSEKYVKCLIDRIERHCLNVFQFHFKLPDDTCLEFTAGQHLISKEHLDPTSSISRPYTIVSQPGRVHEFRVLVKLYENGTMSNIIRSKWKQGSNVLWRGPFGGINYKANQAPCVILIAAGTGIIPLYQIAKQIVDNESDETLITLLYCCRRYQEIVLRSEIHHLSSYWNFRCRYFLDEEDSDVNLIKRHDEVIKCTKLTEEVLIREINGTPSKADFYICGPKNFESDIISYLKRLGYCSVAKC